MQDSPSLHIEFVLRLRKTFSEYNEVVGETVLASFAEVELELAKSLTLRELHQDLEEELRRKGEEADRRQAQLEYIGFDLRARRQCLEEDVNKACEQISLFQQRGDELVVSYLTDKVREKELEWNTLSNALGDLELERKQVEANMLKGLDVFNP